MGSSINGPFSMNMLNNQRVYQLNWLIAIIAIHTTTRRFSVLRRVALGVSLRRHRPGVKIGVRDHHLGET